MFRFFRNVRQLLLFKGNTNKYLKYAIGEIILVVIGILIALQINSWNDRRMNRKIELNYLLSLKEEITLDSVELERTWFKSYPRKIGSLEKAKA